MKVLLDMNVVLDLLLERGPFIKEAREIFTRIERGGITGTLCATTVTTIHYLVAKNLNRGRADEIVADLLRLFGISRMDREVLLAAVQANGQDFEDTVLYTSALFDRVDAIVTRDRRGFDHSKVPVFTPGEFLKWIR